MNSAFRFHAECVHAERRGRGRRAADNEEGSDNYSHGKQARVGSFIEAS